MGVLEGAFTRAPSRLLLIIEDGTVLRRQERGVRLLHRDLIRKGKGLLGRWKEVDTSCIVTSLSVSMSLTWLASANWYLNIGSMRVSSAGTVSSFASIVTWI